MNTIVFDSCLTTMKSFAILLPKIQTSTVKVKDEGATIDKASLTINSVPSRFLKSKTLKMISL